MTCGAQHLRRVPALPLPGAQQPLAFARAPRGHQDQRQRDIGGGIGHGARGVGDGKPGGAGGRDVDMVVADAEIGQDPGAGRGHIGKDIGLKRSPSVGSTRR